MRSSRTRKLDKHNIGLSCLWQAGSSVSYSLIYIGLPLVNIKLLFTSLRVVLDLV